MRVEKISVEKKKKKTKQNKKRKKFKSYPTGYWDDMLVQNVRGCLLLLFKQQLFSLFK